VVVEEDLLGQWAPNLMLMNMSPRKSGRAVHLKGVSNPVISALEFRTPLLLTLAAVFPPARRFRL
jgi:hypothetical protein